MAKEARFRHEKLLAELIPLFLTQEQLFEFYKVISSQVLTEEVNRALRAVNSFFEEEHEDPGTFFRGFLVKAYSERFDAFLLLPLHTVQPTGEDGELEVELRMVKADGACVRNWLPASHLWPTHQPYKDWAKDDPDTTLCDDDLYYVIAMTERKGHQYLFPLPPELTLLRKKLLHGLRELLRLRQQSQRFTRRETRVKIEEAKQEPDLPVAGRLRVPSAAGKDAMWGRSYEPEEKHRCIRLQPQAEPSNEAELRKAEREVETLLRQLEASVQAAKQEAAEKPSSAAAAAEREAAGHGPSAPRDPRRLGGTRGGGGGAGFAVAPWHSSPGAASAFLREVGALSSGACDSPPPAKRLRTQYDEAGSGSQGGSTPLPTQLQVEYMRARAVLLRPLWVNNAIAKNLREDWSQLPVDVFEKASAQKQRVEAVEAQLRMEGQAISCEEDCVHFYAALVREEREQQQRQRLRQQDEQPSWKGKVALGVDGKVVSKLTSGSMCSQPLLRHTGASAACASVISSIKDLKNNRIPLVFPEVGPIPDLNELIPEVGVLSFQDDKELECMTRFARERNWYDVDLQSGASCIAANAVKDSAPNVARCGVSSVKFNEGRFTNHIMTVFVFTCTSSWATQTLVPQLRDAHMQKQFLDNKAFLMLFRLLPIAADNRHGAAAAALTSRGPGGSDCPKGPVAVAVGGEPAGGGAHAAAHAGPASASPGLVAAGPGPGATAVAAGTPAAGLVAHHPRPADTTLLPGTSSLDPTATAAGAPAAAPPEAGAPLQVTSPATVSHVAGPLPGVQQGAAAAAAAAQQPEGAALAAAPADGAGTSAAPAAAAAGASVQQAANGPQAQPEAAALQPGGAPAPGAAVGWSAPGATAAAGAYHPQQPAYYGSYWSSTGTHAAYPAYSAPTAPYQEPYNAAPYQHASHHHPAYQSYYVHSGYNAYGYGYEASHGYGAQTYAHWPAASQQAYAGYYTPSGQQAPAPAPNLQAASAAAAAAPAVVAPVAAAAVSLPAAEAVIAADAPWRALDQGPAPEASGMSMSEGSDEEAVKQVGPGSHVPPSQDDGRPFAAVATHAAGVPHPPQGQPLGEAQHAPRGPPPSPPPPPPGEAAVRHPERERTPPSYFSDGE
ncbi:hypothetical protein PLESTB_001736000 [Pleodorina starrii]|uniref:Uncharacterized protein n=1 Tax=Pleodorina starrii TaxID=330485 RepID=A0A9W6C0J5_9CHLO|nr:hypothetical protein PLESTM_000744100 [Pleodorina starrii]GLC61252.1 hypothetical protein PLESTB_001736000 [Pleodorina starrii]GLC74742.1 hypothetical protein PLESTF_001550500 [Pleodorina starrii]